MEIKLRDLLMITCKDTFIQIVDDESNNIYTGVCNGIESVILKHGHKVVTEVHKDDDCKLIVYTL